LAAVRTGEAAGFVATATTGSCPIAGMANDEKRFYGIQFHPEVAHTPYGKKILGNFLFSICRCKRKWTPRSPVSIRRWRRPRKQGRIDSTMSAVADILRITYI